MTKKQRHSIHVFIAEKVMGWKPSPGRLPGKGQFCEEVFAGRLSVWIEDAFWSPSDDPTQAMMVLEKCAEHTFPGEMGILKDKGYFEVSLLGYGPVARARTLPEAICLFAKEVFQ